jgi:DNA-binding NarL/FixJ family response regulator
VGRVIRVLIVDDHPVVRAGLVGMLETAGNIVVVGASSDGRQAVRIAAELRPDVVLMDLRMPGFDGVTATEAVLAAAPTTRVLILTAYDTHADIVRAIEAGAIDYVLKDTTAARLVEAVEAAARGESMLSSQVSDRLLDGRRTSRPTDALSRREVEVLRLVAAGMSNVEIGRALCVEESTIKTHLIRTFAKLGVSDRTAAVMKAIASGLMPTDTMA